MPEMDGPTTLLRLKASGKTSHIPVLLLTAKVQGPDQRRFAEMGVEAILLKPFDPLTLARQISAALGWEEGE
jgi:CheY-like chemotaxis protein